MSDEQEVPSSYEPTAWEAMTLEFEALIRKHGKLIFSRAENEMCEEHRDGCGWNAPNWDSIFSLQDWSLTLSVEDTAEEAHERGYWVLHVEPWRQLPYRTRGLLETRLDEL